MSKQTTVGIYRGAAAMDIKGKTFAGAWNVVINDEKERRFSIQYLVRAEPSSPSALDAILGDWSENDYAIVFEASDSGDDFAVNQEMMQELKGILEQVQRGEIHPTNVFESEVDTDYVDKILSFIIPRFDLIPQKLEGGVVGSKDIEVKNERNDVPPLPRA